MMQTTAMLEPHICDQAMCMSVVGKTNLLFCVGAALWPMERISRCSSQNMAGKQEAAGSLPCIVTIVGLNLRRLLQDRLRRLLRSRSPPPPIRRLVLRGPLHFHFLVRDPHCPSPNCASEKSACADDEAASLSQHRLVSFHRA